MFVFNNWKISERPHVISFIQKQSHLETSDYFVYLQVFTSKRQSLGWYLSQMKAMGWSLRPGQVHPPNLSVISGPRGGARWASAPGRADGVRGSSEEARGREEHFPLPARPHLHQAEEPEPRTHRLQLQTQHQGAQASADIVFLIHTRSEQSLPSVFIISRSPKCSVFEEF